MAEASSNDNEPEYLRCARGRCGLVRDEANVWRMCLALEQRRRCRRLLVGVSKKNPSRAKMGTLAGEAILSAVAIDGPIRRSFDEIAVYRDAERMLTRGFQKLIGKPGQSSSPNGKKLNAAANAVAVHLLQLGIIGRANHVARIDDRAIVEAFPTSFLGVMLQKGGVPSFGPRSDLFYEHLLGPDLERPAPPVDNRLSGLLRLLLPNRQLWTSLANLTDHAKRAASVFARHGSLRPDPQSM